jgi:hypothetical protein
MAVAKFVKDIAAVFAEKGIEVTEETKADVTKLAKKFHDDAAKKAGAKKAKGDKKSPSHVKKPLNAYLSFSGEVREKVKAAHPEMDAKQLTAEIAAQWMKEKKGNTEIYQKYTEKAAEDAEKYKQAKSEKSETENESDGSESESDKSQKKKRAPSAYNVFYSLKYAEFSSNGMSAADAKKEISKVWGQLTPEQKEEYKGKDLSPKKTKNTTQKEEVKAAEKAEKPAEKPAEQAEEPAVKKAAAKPKKAAEGKAAEGKSDKKKAAAKQKKASEETVKGDDDEEEEEFDLEDFVDDAPPPKKTTTTKKALPK